MKAVRRSASRIVVCLVVLGCIYTGVMAQDPCEDADRILAADAKIRSNFEKEETLEIALEAAKGYLQKYGTCEPSKAFIDWLKLQLPSWEARVWLRPRFIKFNDGLKNKKYDDVFAAGSELVQRYPENVNYLLPMGLIGLHESYKNNFKYNDDSIRYAKLALAKLKSGSAEPKKKDGKPVLDASGKELFGAYQFERNAENAISELTYSLGYILYHLKKDKKAGLLYYYEASLTPGPYKSEPRLYTTIGHYYRQESIPIGDAIKVLINKLEIAKTDDEKARLDAEIKAKIALYNGYLERALGACSFAYKYANAKGNTEKELRDEMLDVLKTIHEIREPAVTLDKWIAAAAEKPLPDPTSEVKPIFDAEPVKAAPAGPAKALPTPKPTRARDRKPTD